MRNYQSLLFVFIVLLFFSCNDSDPVELELDSTLKIISECEYDIKIYFDDLLLGDVVSFEEKTWLVSSGSHVVKATCQGASAYEETHEFGVNETTVLTMHIVMQFKSQSTLEIRY